MTKGPWRYESGFSSGAILGADGEIVAEGVRLEDARVILAAQELRDALRLCAGMLSGDEMSKGALIRALEAARRALAPDAAPCPCICHSTAYGCSADATTHGECCGAPWSPVAAPDAAKDGDAGKEADGNG